MGRYYYRVRAIDQSKKPGHWSEAMDITVTPYPPELKLPKNDSTYSYYELPPKIQFEWKAVEGKTEYEIFIYKTTGKKALQERIKTETFETITIPEGEYMWKVRTVAGIYESAYGEPRRFTIEKKEFNPPKLIFPIGGQGVPAYRSLHFQWEKDPISHYSDLEVQSKKEEKNIKETTEFDHNYFEPGEFSWSVRAKEGDSTPGLKSSVEKFEVRNDIDQAGNQKFEFGWAPMFEDMLQGGTSYKRSRLDTSLVAKWYPALGFGLALDFHNLGYERSPYILPQDKWTALMLLRFGSVGFSQEFSFGYRNQDEVLVSGSDVLLFSTSGAVIGTRLGGTVSRRWRIDLQGYYYKPVYHLEKFGDLVSDAYDFSLGAGWNIYDQFWLHYRLRYEKFIAQAKLGGSSFATEWEVTRWSPLHVGVSWEF